MADEPDNIMLVMLRQTDGKLDRIVEDVQNPKVRMTSVEEGSVGVNRRFDRIEDRVERRLDLTEVR